MGITVQLACATLEQPICPASSETFRLLLMRELRALRRRLPKPLWAQQIRRLSLISREDQRSTYRYARCRASCMSVGRSTYGRKSDLRTAVAVPEAPDGEVDAVASGAGVRTLI